MKRKILMLVLSLGMLVTACGKKEAEGVTTAEVVQDTTAEEEPEQEEPMSFQVEVSGSANQVIMVYMVGSDLETEAAMASLDILEIAESGYSQKNTKVLICTGGADYWWIDSISSDKCEVYEVAGDSMELLYTMENENMAEPQTLTEFIDYGYSNYEADYYNLILWNHGGGAVLGFGADENHDYDTLSLAEMDTAFADTRLIADGKHFEWVGFDACLMGMIEVADMVSEYAEYLIASEEVEAGTGWDYSCLKTLSDGEHFEGAQATTEIIKAYSAYYEKNYEYIPDYTLSCLELSQTGKVVEKMEALLEIAGQELSAGGYSKIARVRDQSKTFGKVSSAGFYDTVDLYDLAEEMMTLYPKEASALKTALDGMIVYSETNVHGAYGVSVYFPYENKEYAEMWMQVYETIGFSEEYVSFLKSFTGTLSGDQIAEWSISEIAPVEDTEAPGEYYVQLTETQAANFGHAKYSIWEEDSPGNYVCWINSSDVTLCEDGKLSSGFQGKRFFIGDTSGNSMPCCVTEIERNKDYVKYAIPILITPADSETFTMEAAYIHLKVDEEHPEGAVVGVYNTLDTASTLFPDRELVEIVEGDIISPFYFARTIGFREDGSVSPFEEWEEASGIGDSFEVIGDCRITLRDVEEGVEYCCLFDVTDTQGNSYYTNPIYIQF